MSSRKLARFSKRKYLNMMILKVPTSFDWEAYKADESNADTVEALEAMRFQVNGDYPNSQEKHRPTEIDLPARATRKL